MEIITKRSKTLAHEITEHLTAHNIKVKIVCGYFIPELQRYIYDIKLMPGTKIKKIYECAEDIRVSMKLHLFRPFKYEEGLRIVASVHDTKENKLLKILMSDAFQKSKNAIPLAIGFDFMGNKQIADLKKLVHLLVIGPSGTGKSVAIWCIILSIIVKCTASSVRLLLFDIMSNSLTLFSDVQHLYYPIIKNAETGMQVLESLVVMMKERLDFGEEACETLPFVVCIIDELDETIAGIVDNYELFKRFTNAINSLIHGGRKAKIILILGSHHPTIQNTKININGIVPRIVFQTAKNNSSSTVGVTGANKLFGEGAMIFKSKNGEYELQGSYVTKDEIRHILSTEPPGYTNLDMLEIDNPQLLHTQQMLVSNVDIPDENIPIPQVSKEFANITFWVLQQKDVSSLQIQKHFRMGKRADGIVDELHGMGIIEALFSNQRRKVIPQSINDLSPEIIDFLKCYGYTQETIQSALDNKFLDSQS